MAATGDRAFLKASIRLHRRMTEHLDTLPLYYPGDVMMARAQLKGPLGKFTNPNYSWNVFEWELTQ
jgi:hypothetical protein